MSDKPKSLKQCGVPLGARIVFRAQWLPFLGMCLLMICTLPFTVIWCLLHESGMDFMDGLEDVLQERVDRIKAHRKKVVSLYASHEKATP